MKQEDSRKTPVVPVEVLEANCLGARSASSLGEGTLRREKEARVSS